MQVLVVKWNDLLVTIDFGGQTLSGLAIGRRSHERAKAHANG